eukprot:g13334.t1
MRILSCRWGHLFCAGGAARRAHRSRSTRSTPRGAEGDSASLRGCGLLLPIGPFCPFRSDFWDDPNLKSAAEEMARKQRRQAELTSKFQLGQGLSAEEKSELAALVKARFEKMLAMAPEVTKGKSLPPPPPFEKAEAPEAPEEKANENEKPEAPEAPAPEEKADENEKPEAPEAPEEKLEHMDEADVK